MIKLNTKYIEKFVKLEEIAKFSELVKNAHKQLYDDSDIENGFKGWRDLPLAYDSCEIKRIESISQRIRKNSDILVVIGIGGSYLGSRAAIEFLNSENYNYIKKDTPDIFFIGNSISSREIDELLKICEGKEISVNVISKSGTTTEPAIAFRIFKEFMESKYGKAGARERIYCTTDPSHGALKKMADREGYECFEIPQNIGGRYSVLTAVGLLPIAVSGAHITEILRGATDACKKYDICDLENNDCYKYAVLRNIFYQKGKQVEIICGYEPGLNMFFQWWKQLFGESEGKNGKGIFPASAIFSADLHSLGQFIQQGSKILFETILTINDDKRNIVIKKDVENLDNLNYLVGKSLHEVNKKVFEATALAHESGEVPGIVIECDNNEEYDLGFLIYFFEKACAISGYLLGVNPFDQPGVEAYKKNMFTLLGKPGYNKS